MTQHQQKPSHGRQEGRKPKPEHSTAKTPDKPEDHGVLPDQFPGEPLGDATREHARPKDTGRSGA